jgi:hypothetical protein
VETSRAFDPRRTNRRKKRRKPQFKPGQVVSGSIPAKWLQFRVMYHEKIESWNENQEKILWSLKENRKFTIGARNYKNYTAIGVQSALDLRAEVDVWCMIV